MPTPEQSLQNLNQFLDNSIDSFSKDIPGIQDEVFRKVQGLLKDLDLSRGDVKATAKNLRKINRIKREIEQIILSEKYIDEVTKFNQAFEKGTDLQTSYFNSIQKGFSTPDFISTLRDASMANTKAALTESGIQSNIVDKAGDIIQRNIAESANFSDLVDDMRNFLTKTEQSVGALSRYTSQIVTDSLNTYAAEYNRFVSDNLNLQWFVYSGAIVEGSRSFCRSLIKKKYVHKSEFGKVSRGSFVPKPIDLKGLKPNTNAKTLQINRGGWHCNHLLSPIAEEFVPKNIRAKFAKATTEKPAPVPPPVTPKATPKPKKVFRPAKTTAEAEQRIRQAGVKDVNLKGLKPDELNSVLESMEAQAEYKGFSLDKLETYRDSKARAIALYSPSNNSISLNLSNIKKWTKQEPLKSFKSQIKSAEADIIKWKNYEAKFRAADVNKFNTKEIRRASSRINNIESRIKDMERKILNNEEPLHFSISSSQNTASEGLAATITHEMGHYRDFKQLRGTKAEFFGSNRASAVSDYAKTNKAEYFAEAYAAYFHGFRNDVPEQLLNIFDSWR